MTLEALTHSELPRGATAGPAAQSETPLRIGSAVPITSLTLVVVFFLSLFLLFPSLSYTVADGSTRAVNVFFEGRPFLHGNNHLLYPIHIYYFNEKILRPLGLKASDGFEYFRNSTILNSTAGALALGLIFLLLLRLTSSYFFSFSGAVLFGFSRSFLLSATNPNEPMPGFLLSVIAVLLSLLGIQRRNVVMCGLSGLFLAYATATYQSMFLVGPALLVLYLIHAWKLRSIQSILAFSLTAGIALLLVYASAYYIFFGITDPAQLIGRFLQLDGADNKGIWGRFDWIQLVAIWPGLVRAFFEVPYELRRIYYGGAENLGALLMEWALPLILVGTSLLVTAFAGRRLRRKDSASFRASNLVLVFFCFTLFGPFYWIAGYSKLWLQPLAALVVWQIYVLAKFTRLTESPAGRVMRQWVLVLLLAFQAVIVPWNLSRVLATNHRGEPGLMQAVRALDDAIPDDAVVFCTWDSASVTLRDFLGKARTFHTVEGYAIRLDEAEVVRAMDGVIERAMRRDRNVYFLGILNLTKDEWNFFLGNRAGIGIEVLNKYREGARLVKSIRVGTSEVVLYQYQDRGPTHQ